jgi:hypothetical protein
VRVKSQLSDERGATAVMMMFLLVVLIGMLSLSVDGGLLWTKYRQVRRANDAGAMAAALECGVSGNESKANASADLVAAGNASDVKGVPGSAPGSLNGYNAYDTSCGASKGSVTVHYGSLQTTGGGVQLMFWPAVCALLPSCSVSAARDVGAQATAIWGFAGGGPVFPLAIGKDRLSTCGIPSAMTDADVGQTRCAFYFSNSGSDASNWTWGLIDLDTWNANIADGNACNSGSAPNTQKYQDWYANPPSEGLKDDPMNNPTYVCLTPGKKNVLYDVGNSPNNVLSSAVLCATATTTTDVAKYCPSSGQATTYSFPVSASTTVTSGATFFGIVGFASLQPANLCQGANDGSWSCAQSSTASSDQALCNTLLQSLGVTNGPDTRCLVAEWEGYTTSNTDDIVDNSFGNVRAARLTA